LTVKFNMSCEMESMVSAKEKCAFIIRNRKQLREEEGKFEDRVKSDDWYIQKAYEIKSSQCGSKEGTMRIVVNNHINESEEEVS